MCKLYKNVITEKSFDFPQLLSYSKPIHLTFAISLPIDKSGADVAAEQVEIKQLPIKAYLDQNLMPLLLEALTELSKQKPEEPIEFVAKYLLEHNPEKN